MRTRIYYIQLLRDLLFLYLASLFFMLTDLVDEKKLLDYRFHFGLIGIAVLGALFHCFLECKGIASKD